MKVHQISDWRADHSVIQTVKNNVNPKVILICLNLLSSKFQGLKTEKKVIDMCAC